MNDSILRFLAVISLSLGAFACTTEVTLPTGTGGAETGAGGAQTGAGTGGATAGTGDTTAGTGGTGGASPCAPQPESPDAGFAGSTCADLASLIVSDPVVIADNADGKVSPGEGATLHVKLSALAGKGFNAYPGVTFSSDLAMVTDPGSGQLYAILACQIVDLTGHVLVPSSVAKGTVVHVTAQVSSLSAACPPGDAITIPITIE